MSLAGKSRHLTVPESKKVLKHKCETRQRHRCHLEGTPTDPMWDNLVSERILIMG